MKKELLHVIKEEAYMDFFERNRDGYVKKNTMVKLTYSDGSIRYTVSNSSDNRVAGSQYPYDYNTIRLCRNGRLNNDVYKNSFRKNGDGFSYGYGIHGTYGVRCGGYIVTVEGNKCYRETYNLKMTKGRDVTHEHFCTWNYEGIPIMESINEAVETRKTRSDKGKAHNTEGIRIKQSEVTSEYRRSKKNNNK